MYKVLHLLENWFIIHHGNADENQPVYWNVQKKVRQESWTLLNESSQNHYANMLSSCPLRLHPNNFIGLTNFNVPPNNFSSQKMMLWFTFGNNACSVPNLLRSEILCSTATGLLLTSEDFKTSRWMRYLDLEYPGILGSWVIASGVSSSGID